MKKLLIHSDNTSFNRDEIFPTPESFRFDVDFDKDVDLYINEKLHDEAEGGLRKKIEKSDILFIKVALSENYLEYLGLRLAYHIRLTKCLGKKAYLPIVFIAEESIQFLGLTCHDPSILLTKGIYLIKETLDDYHKTKKWFNEGRIKPLDDFTSFVNSITILPPANYQTHHSIANEWALVRFTSMFEKDETNPIFINLLNKVQSLDYLNTLHFKYLEAISSREKFNSKRHNIDPIINRIDGMRIGIIDDEGNKGWFEFYDYILSKSNAQALPYSDFRKGESKDELINKVKNWIRSKCIDRDPVDIFIVDLRLHDDDFTEIEFVKLSGIQIIEFINSINPGIQIIISTASNKVWNYQNCLEFGVRHYSVKESPETYNSRRETRALYIHFSKQIYNAARNSFLAGLYRKIKDIKNNNIFINQTGEQASEFAKLTFEKNGLLDQIFNLLALDSTNDSIINQCLLIAFQILEKYCDLDVVASFGNNTEQGNRLSSGSIMTKDGKDSKNIFINLPNQKISSWFDLVNGRFQFQVLDSNETPISFNVFEKMTLMSSYKSGIDASSLVKMITVLYFRDGVSKMDIEKIMGYRYYRSNVAAHLTGKVDPNYKIKAKDIEFFIDVFTDIFKQSMHQP